MAVKPVPDGYNTVSAYLVVKDVVEAIEFYKRAFGAEDGAMMRTPDGRSVVHAEIRIGTSAVMLSQENPQWGTKSAETLGGSPISLHLYVDDADKVFARATEAGCNVVAPLMDAFWGDRYGKVSDPFGIQWGIATHAQDLSKEEIDRRMADWFASHSG